MKTATLQVTLTPELQRFVEGQVRTGRYGDSSGVIRAALRLFEQGDERAEDPALDSLIQEGLDSGPAQPLTRRAWDQIWAESEKVARRMQGKQERAA